MFNQTSLDTLCAALAYAMGVEAPAHAAPANEELVRYIDQALGGKKVDRIFMYNPDAIGQWIADKYSDLLREVTAASGLALPLRTVMPSVTPVCFGTMYTGAQPEVHGIREYAKPVIKIDSLFDAMLRAGKKCAIVSNPKCSLNNIFREREMDYYEGVDAAEVNAIAARLILEDKYDLLVVYNGNYDFRQHRAGPEGMESLAELRHNSLSFRSFLYMLEKNWQHHNTLVGFAMDHGCHQIPPKDKNGTVYIGSHGDEIPEDLNICHHYKILTATE